MADISVIDGSVPVVVLIVGAIALVILLARRGRAALVTVAIAAGVALVTLLGLNWLLTRGLNLFPETLPTVVTLWISLGTAAVVLVVGNLVGTRSGGRSWPSPAASPCCSPPDPRSTSTSPSTRRWARSRVHKATSAR